MTLRSKITEFLPLEKVPSSFTFREKISKKRYLYLKKINKLHAASAKAIRESAIKNNGEVRHYLRFLKESEGQKARIYHVAICFLKGKKYSEVEPKVEKKNKINIKDLEQCLIYNIDSKYYKFLKADLEEFLMS